MISILMPIFNGIEFINESVESIIEQTYTKWELIIGINGHPPNSFAYNIAKEYESLYSPPSTSSCGNTEFSRSLTPIGSGSLQIRVIDFPNIKGKANTLNAMLPYCKYDHVAILDVDDIWSDNKLQVQSVFINDYDVVGSQCVYFGDMNNISPQIPIGNISTFDFTKVNPVINSSAIIRKDLCWWNVNYDGIEDYDLWLRLRKQNKTFYNVDSILVKHRIHQSSAFNSKGNGSKVADLLKIHNM